MSEFEDFDTWENQFASATLPLAKKHKAAESAAYRLESEIAEKAKRIAVHSVDLELYRGQQYHSLPLQDGELAILTEYERNADGTPVCLRLTRNVIHTIKPHIYSVEVTDYRLRFATAGLAVARGTRMIHEAPSITTDAALPVVWMGPDDIIGRYQGHLYSPGEVSDIVDLQDTGQLQARLNDVSSLSDTIHGLSRSVSLENEYPYS